VSEDLLIGIWGSYRDVQRQVLEEWVPIALADRNVEACTISFREADQGRFADGDPVDALIALGLDRAHDLDDVPDRSRLYDVAREVNVWRVDTRTPVAWDRTWPDGEYAPGVKMVSFVRRAEALTHEQFVRHWTERHAPLARRHHLGLWNYRQHVVRRAYTPGGAGIDGIAELNFRTRASFETEFYDSDEGRAAIAADVKRFIERPSGQAALMRELPLKTPRD
jgi:uncharacterized protein (TIGR02118 family)